MRKNVKKYSYTVSLGSHDSRLKEGPAGEVIDYMYSKGLNAAIPSFEQMIQYNLAHTVELCDKKVIPNRDAKKLIETLRWIKTKKLEYFDLDPKLENLMPNIEAILIDKLGQDVGGKLITGRARSDPQVVSAILFLRKNILMLLEEVNDLRSLILSMAETHMDTLMPGYTHVQHAQPSTLAHYFLCVGEALETDFSRITDSYKRINKSPAEYGAGWGTSYPIDRRQVAAYLGFDGLIENTKYAHTSFERGIEVLACLTNLTVNMSRLAEDIYYWCTYEYNFADISDAYASTSYIMPQKKSAYSLEAFVALANRTISALTRCAVQASRTSFGFAAHLSFALYDGWQTGSVVINDTLGAIKLLKGILSSMRFNIQAMGKCTGIHFTQSTFLADTLFKERGISFRTAHRIVGKLVRKALDENKKPYDINSQMLDNAAIEITGKPINLSEKSLKRVFNEIEIIKSHKGIGGTSPVAIRKSLRNRLRELARDEQDVITLKNRISKAEHKLEQAINNIVNSQ